MTEVGKIRRLNKRSTIRAKELSRVQRYSGANTCYIISGDKGIMEGRTAKNNEIGGIPLLRVR
jgi:ribosomal protein S8